MSHIVANRIAAAALVCAVALSCAPAHADWIWSPERGWYNPKSETRGTAQQLYAKGLSLFEAGDFAESARTFDDLAKGFPGSRYAKKAQYYSGEAHFEAGEFWDAYESYEAYLSNYPESAEIESIVEKEFEIGRAFLNGARRKLLDVTFLQVPSPASGVKMLESVIEHSPYSDFADDSLYAIANFHFRKKQFDLAAEAYKRLHQTYPDSEWATISKYQAAICSRSMSQGAVYDAGSLERARQQLVEYSAEHPTETEVKGVSGQIASIDEELAYKLWSTALFYEKSGKVYSAAYCCRRLQLHYPDTSYAALAAEWIGQHPETMKANSDPGDVITPTGIVSELLATPPAAGASPAASSAATPAAATPAAATPAPVTPAAPGTAQPAPPGGRFEPRGHSTQGSN